jgi:hypothetical protein
MRSWRPFCIPLGMAWFYGLDGDAKAQPPDGEF